MDVTLHIFAVQTEHKVDREAQRHLRGDVVNIYERSRVTEPPHPRSRLIFIHITNVPIDSVHKLDRIRQAVLGEPNEDGERAIIHRHLFRIDLSALPTAVRNALQRDREYTVDWPTARNWVRSRIDDSAVTVEV